MDNLGTWALWSLPLYFAFTSYLKGRSQIISLWVYLWSLGALWSLIFWHGYHLYLSAQRMNLGNPETLPQYILTHWIEVGLMSFLMALPPVLYLRDRRKLYAQSAG
jgi:hypothetical protein